MGFLQTTITETKTSSFTPSAAATIYLIDATAGNLTVTLPVAATHANSVYEFRRIDAGGHTVTVAGATDSTCSPAVADLVNGAASVTLAAGTALCLVGDGGAGWYDLSSTSAGGGGDLTPDTVIIGDPATAFSFPIPDTNPAHTPYRLVVAGQPADSNDENATVIIGSDQPFNNQIGLWGVATNAVGVYGTSSVGDGVFGQSASGIGAHGYSPTGIGVMGFTDSGTAAHFEGGPVNLVAIAAPSASPAAGAVWLYLDSADGKVKIKESGGTVHALW